MKREDDDRLARAAEGLLREAGEAGPKTFEPGFAGRVMERVRAERADVARGARSHEGSAWSLDAVLRRQFLRLAPVGLAALVAVGAYNLSAASDVQSPVEAALGLEPVTLDAVYEMSLIGRE